MRQQGAIAPERGNVITLDAVASTAITGAILVDSTVGAKSGQTIWVEGDSIEAVRPAQPSDINTPGSIDLTGRWLIPGLIDSHLHLAGGRSLAVSPTFAEQRDMGLSLIKTSLSYSNLLSDGITTIRSLGGESSETAVAIRRAMLDGFLLGPRVITAGSAVVPSGKEPSPTRLVEAVKATRRNFGHFADAVMLGNCFVGRQRRAFTKGELGSLISEGHRRRIRVALRPVDLGEAISALDEGVDTLEGIPSGADDRLIVALKKSGAALVPLLASSRQKRRDGEFVATAHRAGIAVLAGSDWSPLKGHALSDELAALSAIGFSGRDVLGAATSRAAAALGLGTELGDFQPGKRAEFVALSADPFEPGVLGNSANVESTFRVVDPLTS